MATAKMHDGVAIVAYVNGKAVDSEGVPIPGAPKQPADTDPSLQPGAAGSPAANPIEHLASMLAGKLGASPASARAEEESDSDEGQAYTLEELPAHLATLTTVEDVRAARKGDTRKGAKALYAARIAELEAAE